MLRLSIILALCACVSAVDLGGTCTLDTDCTQAEVYCNINSPCTSGTCACLTGWTENSGSTACVQINIKAVEEACNTVENQCSGDHTTCTSSVCECRDGYYGDAGDFDCDFGTSLAKIGDNCTYNADCEAYKYYYEREAQGLIPENVYQTALCTSAGQCECNTDYVASTDETRCVSDLAAYGVACSVNGDCDTHAHMDIECVSSKCGCGTGFTVVSGWNVYTYMENQCVDDGITLNLGSGAECWNEQKNMTADHNCGKGLTCLECPGDTSVRICQNSGAVFGLSLALMLAALFLHL